jgi:hypothetical protein
MSDFAVNKRRLKIYGKRTSFGNHEFNIEKPESFIRKKSSTRVILYTVNQINTGVKPLRKFE